MFEVAITGNRVTAKNDTGDYDESGWIDPTWSMTVLYTDREDVTVSTFETRAEAVQYIEDTIGWTEVDGGDVDRFYATDTREDYTTGDVFSYCGHITEV